VLHTNHPLAAAGAAEDAGYSENSQARLASLSVRLGGAAAGFAPLAEALCACDDPRHPVCRPAGSNALAGFTTGSMVSRLAPGGVTTWISLGPPREMGYAAFDLGSELDGQGLAVGG